MNLQSLHALALQDQRDQAWVEFGRTVRTASQEGLVTYASPEALTAYDRYADLDQRYGLACQAAKLPRQPEPPDPA